MTTFESAPTANPRILYMLKSVQPRILYMLKLVHPPAARWRHPISCLVTRCRQSHQSIKLSPCDVNPEVEVVVLKTGQCRDRMLCVVLTHINGMCRVGVMTQYVRW